MEGLKDMKDMNVIYRWLHMRTLSTFSDLTKLNYQIALWNWKRARINCTWTNPAKLLVFNTQGRSDIFFSRNSNKGPSLCSLCMHAW